MLWRVLPRPRFSAACLGARLLTALAWMPVLGFVGLIAPASGSASNPPWAPSPASLVTAARTCPSPSVAADHAATCWSVVRDASNPFYLPNGPYAWGQCTYWALQKRPDLWNDRSSADPEPGNWTAYTWPRHAALEGLTVDHAPAAGAVIVWPRTADNVSGHVAYVQSVAVDSVTGDDRIRLQEMNDTTFDDPAHGQGDTMTMSMDAGDLAKVQIIHAPGDTAGPGPEPPLRQRTAMRSTTKTSVSSGPMTPPAPRLP